MTQPEPASKRRTNVLVLAIAIAAFAPAVFWMARPFFTAGVLAAILAVALDPVHSRTTRLVRRPSVAALITTSVALAPVLAALMLAGMAVNRGIRSGALADFIRTGQRLTGTTFDVHAIQKAVPELSRIAGGAFTCVFAAVFLSVLLVHGKAWLMKLTSMLSMDASASDRIITAVRDAIVANVDGILAMGVGEAVLFGSIFQLSGIASAGMWGAFAGLSSMVPIAGAAAVWLPLSVTLAVHGIWMKAIVMGLVCLATQEAVAFLVLPRLIGTRLRQSPLLIALSILGATSAFGVLGILVGPVVVAVLGALVQELRNQLRPGVVPVATLRE